MIGSIIHFLPLRKALLRISGYSGRIKHQNKNTKGASAPFVDEKVVLAASDSVDPAKTSSTAALVDPSHLSHHRPSMRHWRYPYVPEATA